MSDNTQVLDKRTWIDSHIKEVQLQLVEQEMNLEYVKTGSSLYPKYDFKQEIEQYEKIVDSLNEKINILTAMKNKLSNKVLTLIK